MLIKILIKAIASVLFLFLTHEEDRRPIEDESWIGIITVIFVFPALRKTWNDALAFLVTEDRDLTSLWAKCPRKDTSLAQGYRFVFRSEPTEDESLVDWEE